MAARVVVLAACDEAASVPPSSAAMTVVVALSAPRAAAASAAPAGMRMTLCMRSHNESTPGILSAKNSTDSITPLAISMAGCCNTASPGGNATQPS